MRIRYHKPLTPDQLSSLGLPTDPTDARGLDALPTGTLQRLINTVYEQLNSDFSSLETADWYDALVQALRQRTGVQRGLERPA